MKNLYFNYVTTCTIPVACNNTPLPEDLDFSVKFDLTYKLDDGSDYKVYKVKLVKPYLYLTSQLKKVIILMVGMLVMKV